MDGTARGPALGQPGALFGDADTAAHLDGRAPKGSALAPALIFGYERSLKTVWGTLVAPLDHTRWSHVVATYDLVTPTTNPRGTMRLYVNGALVASRRSDFVPMLPRVSSNAYVALGSNTTGWLRYDGGLDEIATYTRTLSAAEVAEHYRIGTTGR